MSELLGWISRSRSRSRRSLSKRKKAGCLSWRRSKSGAGPTETQNLWLEAAAVILELYRAWQVEFGPKAQNFEKRKEAKRRESVDVLRGKGAPVQGQERSTQARAKWEAACAAVPQDTLEPLLSCLIGCELLEEIGYRLCRQEPQILQNLRQRQDRNRPRRPG